MFVLVVCMLSTVAVGNVAGNETRSVGPFGGHNL